MNHATLEQIQRGHITGGMFVLISFECCVSISCKCLILNHRLTGEIFYFQMDKVENSTLESLFDYKKKQLRCSTRMSRMFQLIPVQFSEMVSHIGFHAEYAPPEGTIVRLHIAFDNLVNDRFLWF